MIFLGPVFLSGVAPTGQKALERRGLFTVIRVARRPRAGGYPGVRARRRALGANRTSYLFKRFAFCRSSGTAEPRVFQSPPAGAGQFSLSSKHRGAGCALFSPGVKKPGHVSSRRNMKANYMCFDAARDNIGRFLCRSIRSPRRRQTIRHPTRD